MDSRQLNDGNIDVKARKKDIDFWVPWLSRVFKEHSLALNKQDITAGYNSTYPVFVCGKLVVKFFGYHNNWENAFTHEVLAHKLLNDYPKIKAPRMIGSGFLFEEEALSWPYLITERVEGDTWLNRSLDLHEKINIVEELGSQIKLLHAIPPMKGVEKLPYQNLDMVDAARQSSLPSQLVDEVPTYVSRYQANHHVLAHSDIVDMHVFIKDGSLSGIIDWGDLCLGDRYYDLAKMALSLFPMNRELMKVFLKASQWPMSDSFADKCLQMALYRQAVGLTQHHSFDIFFQLPNLYDFTKVQTLEEYAKIVFGLDDEK